MTVCLGAVCSDRTGKGGYAVVVASDRMVTMGNLTEFEHEVPKVTRLTPHSVSLVAGDALRGSRLVRDVIGQLKGGGTTGLPQIADHTAARYSELRLAQVNDDLFRPRGMDIRSFYTGQQLQLNPQLAVGLDNAAATFNYNVELLVAGVDDDGGQLFHIGNPGGFCTPFHHTGFGAIGSGNLHAVQSMIAFKHAPTRTLAETVLAVYSSKRRAEVAPGVGTDTDMVIIESSGITQLTAQVLNALSDTYSKYSAPVKAEILDEVSKLNLFSTVEVASDSPQ